MSYVAPLSWHYYLLMSSLYFGVFIFLPHAIAFRVSMSIQRNLSEFYGRFRIFSPQRILLFLVGETLVLSMLFMPSFSKELFIVSSAPIFLIAVRDYIDILRISKL